MMKKETEHTYQSPVTGQTIRVYPTEDDWVENLRAAGRYGPHWEASKKVNKIIQGYYCGLSVGLKHC